MWAVWPVSAIVTMNVAVCPGTRRGVVRDRGDAQPGTRTGTLTEHRGSVPNTEQLLHSAVVIVVASGLFLGRGFFTMSVPVNVTDSPTGMSPVHVVPVPVTTSVPTSSADRRSAPRNRTRSWHRSRSWVPVYGNARRW